MSRRKKSSSKRKKIVKRVKRLHRAEGRAIRSLGSIAATKKRLRDQLKYQLAWGLLAKDQAKTKRAKKKIAKRLSPVKRHLRQLSGY